MRLFALLGLADSTAPDLQGIDWYYRSGRRAEADRVARPDDDHIRSGNAQPAVRNDHRSSEK